MNPAWWWLIGPAAFLTIVAAAIFVLALIYGRDGEDHRVTSRGTNGYKAHQ